MFGSAYGSQYPLHMNDPNWLLSALAETAGALVAIIGGFLVSRLVGLSSQRSGLRGRLAEVERSLEAGQRLETSSRKELVDWEQNLLVGCFIGDLARAKGDASGLGLAACETYTLTQAEISECVAAESDAVRDALRFFDSHPVSHASPAEVGEFLAANGAHIEGRGTRAFGAVYDVLRERAPKPAPGRGLFGLPYIAPGLVGSDTGRLLRGMRSLQEQQFDANYHNNLIRRWQDAKHAVDIHKLEREAVQNGLSRLGKPSGLISGAAVLTYLTISGVVVPLSLLPATSLSSLSKWLVLGAFFVGLIWLLLYLLASIRSLGKPEPDRRLRS